LIMKIPGVEPCRREQLVGLVDVLPTITDLVGLAAAAGGFDGRSLLPTVHENKSAGDEYWIENWSHQPSDDEPHVMCRAIRCADGRKYIWNGVDIDWDGLDEMADDVFVDYAARVTYGNPPSEWLGGQIRSLASQQGRAQAIRALLGNCRPRHIMLENVDVDLTESSPIIVDENHARWNEHRAYQQKMEALTAVPRFARSISAAEEEELKHHLAQLGYL